MKRSLQPPIYSQVAYDIAAKIAAGELRENERFSGRSLMSSQYGVSPETIRRALRLLSDLGIVSIHQNVGSVVLSQSRAGDYVDQYKMGRDLRILKAELHRMTQERDALTRRIDELIEQIIDLSDRFRHSDRLRTYEIAIPPDSRILGRSISALQFRQNTGATIVAVRRGEEIMLSPAPQTVLQPNDLLVVACDIGNIGHVNSFICD